MPLAQILTAIQAASREAIHSLEEETTQRVAALEAAAREEAALASARAEAEAKAGIGAARARQMQATRLAATRLIGKALDESVDQILASTYTAMQGVRGRTDYPGLLLGLVGEATQAVASFDDNLPLRIDADPRDRSLLEDLSDQYDLRFNLHCLGGVVVTSHDERIVVDNTLESRFARAQPYLRQRLATWLKSSPA